MFEVKYFVVCVENNKKGRGKIMAKCKDQETANRVVEVLQKRDQDTVFKVTESHLTLIDDPEELDQKRDVTEALKEFREKLKTMSPEMIKKLLDQTKETEDAVQ